MSLLPQNPWTTLKEWLLVTLGIALYVLAWSVFLVPNNLVGGGVTGISSIIQYATHGAIKIGYPYFVINAVLLGAAFFIMGSSFGAKTIYAIILASVGLNVCQGLIPESIIQTLALDNGKLMCTIMGGIILLASMFFMGFVLTSTFKSINAIMFVCFALVGLAWAAINVNSLPMVVEMCKGSDIGKFTGYYYTASMSAQIVTPILAGTLMRLISYKVLFIYAAVFVLLSFVTMTQVKHGDQKVEGKKGLAAFEDMDD